jgi:hypothetical protein
LNPDSLELIQDMLAPISTLFGNPVRAKLYKLNSYATEGFFGAHRDTPKGEDHIGTLVVCLPCGFAGGKLIVKHKDNEYAFDWADKSSELVQWAFIYSDVEHSIEPVKSGVRLTLAYDIFTAQPWMERPLTLDTASMPLGLELEQDLANPSFLSKGGTVAFALAHAYPVPMELGSFKVEFRHHLKGADALFYSIALSLGLKVEMRSVYLVEEGEFEDAFEDDLVSANGKKEGKKMHIGDDKVIFLDEFCAVGDENDEYATEDEMEYSGSRQWTGRGALMTSNVTAVFFDVEDEADDETKGFVPRLIEQCAARVELDVIWARKPKAKGHSRAGAYACFGNS